MRLGQKGYDVGKKVSAIKRHIAVDTLGLPRPIAVTTAQFTDHKGALLALERSKLDLTHVKGLLCDGGEFAQGVREILGRNVNVQIAKRSELHTLKAHAQALDRGAQLCRVGEEPKAMEKLRASTQHQLADDPPGVAAWKTLNRLLCDMDAA